MPTDLAIHQSRLGDEECGHLPEGDGKGNSCGPYGEDSNEAFELFDLSDGTEPPSARVGGAMRVCYKCCLVQESERVIGWFNLKILKIKKKIKLGATV